MTDATCYRQLPAAAIQTVFGSRNLPESALLYRCVENWLDWGYALGVLVHDAEVVPMRLIALDRPDLFIDLEANYGIHSMLITTAGVSSAGFRAQFALFE